MQNIHNIMENYTNLRGAKSLWISMGDTNGHHKTFWVEFYSFVKENLYEFVMSIRNKIYEMVHAPHLSRRDTWATMTTK